MEISPNAKKELRSRIFTIATAVAFALAIGSFSLAPARAADHGGGDRRGGGGDHRGGGGDRRGGGDYHRGGGHWGGGYYAPAPDYYYAPEPYSYVPAPAPCYEPGYEGPGYDDPYCSPPPPQGISLFFGL
jgi:hypothetical protein